MEKKEGFFLIVQKKESVMIIYMPGFSGGIKKSLIDKISYFLNKFQYKILGYTQALAIDTGVTKFLTIYELFRILLTSYAVGKYDLEKLGLPFLFYIVNGIEKNNEHSYFTTNLKQVIGQISKEVPDLTELYEESDDDKEETLINFNAYLALANESES